MLTYTSYNVYERETRKKHLSHNKGQIHATIQTNCGRISSREPQQSPKGSLAFLARFTQYFVE